MIYTNGSIEVMTKPKREKSTIDGSPSPQPTPIDAIESLRDYMKDEFSKINENLIEVTEEMVTKDCITSLVSIIEVQKKKIEQ